MVPFMAVACSLLVGFNTSVIFSCCPVLTISGNVGFGRGVALLVQWNKMIWVKRGIETRKNSNFRSSPQWHSQCTKCYFQFFQNSFKKIFPSKSFCSSNLHDQKIADYIFAVEDKWLRVIVRSQKV